MKTSKVILNMDSTLKKGLMLKARKEGMNLSTVLNITARAYMENRLKITALDKDIEEGLADIRAGRTRPMEEVFKELGL
jgi:predicted transcriptional regulator